jgi:hypothetical protein
MRAASAAAERLSALALTAGRLSPSALTTWRLSPSGLMPERISPPAPAPVRRRMLFTGEAARYSLDHAGVVATVGIVVGVLGGVIATKL